MAPGDYQNMTPEEIRELTELTMKLVNLPTENNPPGGDEQAAEKFITDYFTGLGLDVDVFSPADIDGFEGNPAFLHDRQTEGRNNVVGVWKGSGTGRSLILAGHIDVAPKEPLPWTVTGPFESIEKDGRIYGRGSIDMKGGLAAIMTAVSILKRRGWTPGGDIILQSLVDEEFASGNGTIAACFRGYRADAAIIPEPSGMRICAANVGGIMMKITIKGDPGMPYTGEEIFNVSYALADLLHMIKKFEQSRMDAPSPPLWENAVQKRAVVITKVKAGEVKPHGQLGSPIDAWVELSVQTYPGETVESVLAEVNALLGATFPEHTSVRAEPLYHYVEPSGTDPAHPVFPLLCASLSALTGKAETVTAAPFPCDAFAYEKYAHTPSVIFGPSGGNLHSPDEWIDKESLVLFTEALLDFIPKWCSA